MEQEDFFASPPFVSITIALIIVSLRSAAPQRWCFPSTSRRWMCGWDAVGRTLQQPESAQLSRLVRPSADCCQQSLCLPWLILLPSKQRAPEHPAESQLLWRWHWGGSRVPPCPGRECGGGGCPCGSEPRVRALEMTAGGTRKPLRRTRLPFQPPSVTALQSAPAGAGGTGMVAEAGDDRVPEDCNYTGLKCRALQLQFDRNYNLNRGKSRGRAPIKMNELVNSAMI